MCLPWGAKLCLQVYLALTIFSEFLEIVNQDFNKSSGNASWVPSVSEYIKPHDEEINSTLSIYGSKKLGTCYKYHVITFYYIKTFPQFFFKLYNI